MKTLLIYGKIPMLLDDEDVDRVTAVGSIEITHGYAYARQRKTRKRIPVSRIVLNCVGKHYDEHGRRLHVDHINGNTLDNRKENLRLIHVWKNVMNTHGPRKNNRSGAPGVHWEQGGFAVRVGMFGRCAYLGRYRTFEEAAKIRREFVAQMFADPDKYRELPPPRNRNKSGVIGVHRQRNSWIVNHRRRYIGSFATKQEAIAAKQRAIATSSSWGSCKDKL